jgi:hypothetical protein
VRSYLVTATVGGKQKKKIVPTKDAADELAAKWQGCRDESIRHLPTTLGVRELRAAEAAHPFFAELGLTAVQAAMWMVKHYKKPGIERWTDVIEAFRRSRRKKHNLKDDAPDTAHIVNMVSAATSFAEFVKRDRIETPTTEEVEAWLDTRGGRKQLIGDLGSFCKWCVKHEKMPSDPTELVEKPVKVRGKVATTLRPEVVAEHLAILEREAPEWVPYYAICVFAFIRPATRDGEVQRADAEIRAGDEVVFKDGFFVRIGKNGGSRTVPWKLTGPLREWLLAYPIDKGIFPFSEPTKAEREWSAWRTRFGLTKDVLRHTGISAACYSGTSLAEIAIAAENSERMIRTHYLGRWSTEATEALWAIRPKYSALNRPACTIAN